ncbi:hypothetical protein HZA73_09655 [candidate division TA06 bacterium]|nr:hypothetical protein [candidate division TA06 bacterium]
MKTIKYSRLILICLTLLDAGFILLSGFIMQSPVLLIKLLGIVVLFAATMGAALISREWVRPSQVRVEDDQVIVQWNNWELRGRLAERSFSEQKPKMLRLKVLEYKITLYPVGPMFILAGLLAEPIRQRLPRLLDKTFFYNRDKLVSQLSPIPGTAGVMLEIPVILLGKRKVKKWLG